MRRLVSVIILNYNNYLYTIDCLKSLTNQTYQNFEVILVDNGSEYELYLKLKKELKQFEKNLNINLIRSDLNLYFTGGNNKAIKQAKGDFICLLNYDTIVEPDFVEKMIDFLEKHPDAGMISPKIKVYKNKNYLWYAGADIYFRRKLIVKLRGQWEYDPQNQKYNNITTTGYAAGTALFIKKENLNKIGLMDDAFLMYQEDPDWNLRAKKMGYESYYVPTTIIYHKVSPILKKRRIFFRSYFVNRNSQILVWKHGGVIDLILFYYHFVLKNMKILFRQLIIRKRKYLAYLTLCSILQGFRIGFRRRINISCRKYILKDYNFIRRMQKSKLEKKFFLNL